MTRIRKDGEPGSAWTRESWPARLRLPPGRGQEHAFRVRTGRSHPGFRPRRHRRLDKQDQPIGPRGDRHPLIKNVSATVVPIILDIPLLAPFLRNDRAPPGFQRLDESPRLDYLRV